MVCLHCVDECLHCVDRCLQRVDRFPHCVDIVSTAVCTFSTSHRHRVDRSLHLFDIAPPSCRQQSAAQKFFPKSIFGSCSTPSGSDAPPMIEKKFLVCCVDGQCVDRYFLSVSDVLIGDEWCVYRRHILSAHSKILSGCLFGPCPHRTQHYIARKNFGGLDGCLSMDGRLRALNRCEIALRL